MTKERLPYAHVYPLGSPERLQPITPIGKPPPLAVRLAEALPFRRAPGIEEGVTGVVEGKFTVGYNRLCIKRLR
jgi:hypothetical protein